MGAPVILGLIRVGIPAAKIIAKYGKKAYDAARESKVKSSDKISGYNKNTLSTNLTKKQKTFLQNWKKEAKGYDANYSLRGEKLILKNSKKTIKNFDDFFSQPKPTETFGERVPTGLTTGSIITKLK